MKSSFLTLSQMDEDTVAALVIGILVVTFICALVFNISETYACPFCGHHAYPSDVYCSDCGKQLRITKQ